MKRTLIAIALFALPLAAFAHQPRLPETAVVDVVDPEISKAYYAKLEGEPHVYRIAATEPFALYVNLLVPDVPGAKKDVSAAVLKDGDLDHPLVVLGGPEGLWEPYHEEFGGDDYFQGEEFRQQVPEGAYEIRVWSSNNDNAYSLAIGEIEAFPPGEILNALRTMPRIKEDIFGKPWWSAYTTKFVLPMLVGTVVVLVAAAAGAVILIKRRRNRV